ncbi:hypothetical protein [Granulicella sp. L60]|uniref:hypothetical protein n=1 Tax=Granulicella sp. L60 TaxID=1641866 RepID=UPI00131E7E70|nr:hypothetical protein [Granulicella sp. L60]
MIRNMWLGKVAITSVCLIGLFSACGVQAQQDVAHIVTGIVKHVDHDAKVVVVKSADGTEHAIKYTDKTSVKTAKGVDKAGADTWLGAKEGANVTVRYTSKAGEDTAVGVKDAAVKTADAVK